MGHRYQYSLRTLFVVVFVVSIGINCIAVRMRKARAQRTAIEAIKEAGGWAFFGYQVDSSGKGDWRVDPLVPDWLRNVLGDDFIFDVASVDLFAHWHPDWEVPIGGIRDPADPQVAEDLAAHLRMLSKLETLRLVGSQFTDAWLKHLKGLTKLRELHLVDTKITDKGAKMLQKDLPECKIHRSTLRRP